MARLPTTPKGLDDLIHQAGRYQSTLNQALEDSGVMRIAKEMSQSERTLSAFLGPLSAVQSRATSELALNSFGSNFAILDRMKDIASQWQSQFVVPRPSALDGLIGHLDLHPQQLLKPLGKDALLARLELMDTAWMNSLNEPASIEAFVRIQNIGMSVCSGLSFSPDHSEILRKSLGDWREPIEFPAIVLEDFVARSAFYVDIGFDPTLTDMPAAAFDGMVQIAGLTDDFLVDASGSGDIPEADQDVAAPAYDSGRADVVFGILTDLERRLRTFIDEEMTKEYGPDWPAKTLPPSRYAEWERKKVTAEKRSGLVLRHIYYADFSHYPELICQKTNWTMIFEPYFEERASIIESFKRLFGPLHATMHSRYVTEDDELFVRVEVSFCINILFTLWQPHAATTAIFLDEPYASRFKCRLQRISCPYMRRSCLVLEIADCVV